MFLDKTAERHATSGSDPIRQVEPWIAGFQLRLVDRATIFYLGLVAVILIFFHRGVSHWLWLVFGHVLLISSLLLLIRFVDTRRNSKVLTFLRDTYPLFLYTFMFEEVNLIVNILFPFWLEPWLIKWDFLLFDTNPTVWVESIFRPWLTEWMAFAYWSYYVFIPFVGVFLYIKKRSLFHSYVFYLSLTLYVCYFSFLFLSARGPHETLAHLHSERLVVGFFANFVDTIQSKASISGGAFPSSHVAAVWIAWAFLHKFNRGLGWVTLPLILSLSFSVVYMRYHYAVDSIAAIFLVFLTYKIARWLEHEHQSKFERTLNASLG